MAVKTLATRAFKKHKKFKKHHKGRPQKPAKVPRPEVDLNMTGLDAKIHLITQDLKIAQALAANDKKVRDKFLKNLKQWLNTRANSSHRKYHNYIE